MSSVVFLPGSIVAWLLAGLIAGALAGWIGRGRGFGCCADIAVGLIGSVVGGFIIAPFVHGRHVFYFIGTTIVAFIGAMVLIVAVRLIRAII